MKGRSHMARNVGELAEAAGGLNELASTLGVSRQAVYGWSSGAFGPGETLRREIEARWGFRWCAERRVFDSPAALHKLGLLESPVNEK